MRKSIYESSLRINISICRINILILFYWKGLPFYLQHYVSPTFIIFLWDWYTSILIIFLQNLYTWTVSIVCLWLLMTFIWDTYILTFSIIFLIAFHHTPLALSTVFLHHSSYSSIIHCILPVFLMHCDIVLFLWQLLDQSQPVVSELVATQLLYHQKSDSNSFCCVFDLLGFWFIGFLIYWVFDLLGFWFFKI